MKDTQNAKKMNERDRLTTKTYITRIAEDTKGSNKCKHEWRMHDIKRWWGHGLFLYCKKCGSWRKLM